MNGKGKRVSNFNEQYKYAKNLPGDIYGSGLVAEILTKACIEKGYNPKGAGQAINRLLK